MRVPSKKGEERGLCLREESSSKKKGTVFTLFDDLSVWSIRGITFVSDPMFSSLSGALIVEI